MENRQKNYGSVHDTKASMMYNRTAQRNTTYSRGGRIIGKFRKKEILYQTITFANEATVDGTEPCTCPSCGAVSQIKALFEGCPYCHTRFLMQDLYPKVANFYSIEDLSYSKEEIKRT